MRVVALLGLALLAAGCGATRATTTTVGTERAAAPATTTTTTTGPELQVGEVGAVSVSVPGAHVESGPIAKVADDQLVLVAAATEAAQRIATIAAEHPSTNFVVVGAPAGSAHLTNVAGIVLRDDEAALLAGIVAGAAAQTEPAQTPVVGWAGPEERPLLSAFTRGVHDVDTHAEVLHAWARRVPALCKEAALSLVDAGAVVVAAHDGLCADAVASGAHEQGAAALRLSEFEFPDVAATTIVREAVAGVTHGGENVVFGLASGALGIGAVDPRLGEATLIRARTLAANLAGATGS